MSTTTAVRAMDSLALIFKLNNGLIARSLEGLADDEVWRQPAGGGNPIGWIAGHVTEARASLLGALGAPYETGWGKRFARGSGLEGHARVVAETGADAVGVDWAVDLAALRARLPATTVTQGNLDPELLITGGEALDAAVDAIRAATAGLPHIFNLGHGITPPTPVAHVERMLARLRG